MKLLFILIIPGILFSSTCERWETLVSSFSQYATTTKEFEALKAFKKRNNICKVKTTKCSNDLNKIDNELDIVINYFHFEDISSNLLNADIYMDSYKNCLEAK